MTDAVSPETASPADAPLSAWYALALLILVTLFAIVDRQILVLVAEPLRKSLELSDVNLGMLQGAGLALFAGVAAFPIGWLADRYDRRMVMAACVLIWSGATFACGLSQNFWQLMTAATFLGIGEAGLAPGVYSLIPRLFRNRKRLLANTIFIVSANLAVAAGLEIGGILIHWVSTHKAELPVLLRALDAWRLSYFLVALPGPIISLMILTLKVRPREAVDPTAGTSRDNPTLIPYLQEHWRLISGFFIGCGLTNLGSTGINSWVPIIAARVYGESAAQVGSGMAAASAAGLMVGTAVGSLYLKFCLPRLGALTPFRIIWLGALFGVLPTLLFPWATSATILFVLTAIQISGTIAALLPFPTVLQDLAPDALRARVVALAVVVTACVQALGPILIGVVSDHFPGITNGLSIAVAVIAAPGLLMSGILLRTTERAYMRLVASST